MSSLPRPTSSRAAAPTVEPDIDVWHALSDPTRRALLDRLRAGPRTTGALAEGFAMSRFGVMKHLAVLVEARLVLVEARGRERWNYLNPAPLKRLASRWLRPFTEAAADHLEALRRAALAGAAHEEDPTPARRSRSEKPARKRSRQ
jgi:DNA-binding transcriptional ArsR family regulator